jgi:signal transduction histidine kinase
MLSSKIMLMAVPTFVVALGLFYFQSRYLIRQEAVERSNSILRTVIQRVSYYMRTIEVSTNANAWLLEENFRPDSLQSISQRIMRLNPRILSCSVSAEPNVFPQYGERFSVYTCNEDDTIASVIETDYEYADKPWYNVPLKKGKACWIEPFDGHTEGTIDHNEAVATYCHPLRSEQGEVLGVISTELSFSRMAKDIIATEHPYPGAYFVLVGGDGRIFIHPDTTRLFRKTIFTDTDPRQDADLIALGYQMIYGKEGVMHINIGGQRCHVCYHPVPGTEWSLAMVCPESMILVGYHRLAYVIIILIFLGLLAMLWLSQRVIRRNMRPVNKLLGHTKLIAEGHYDYVIPHSDRHDDIGALQNSFAAMQQALNDHMGSISQAAEEIRKRNEQRARDMQLAEEAVKKKTVFIENLSHQIRTPLNIIVGFANILYESIVSRSKGASGKDVFAEEKLNDITGMMKYNAIHLKRMVLMLFDSSSAGGAETLMNNRSDEVSCNEVARECISYTEEGFLGLKIKFRTELSDEVKILTNHLYLMRTLRELLFNAAKYSDGKNISLSVSQTSTTIIFTVEDTGVGLPDEPDEVLYKPFVKIDDLSEGLGLGLPLSKRHALSLGGDLVYDRDYKDGCRFFVEMPK